MDVAWKMIGFYFTVTLFKWPHIEQYFRDTTQAIFNWTYFHIVSVN